MHDYVKRKKFIAKFGNLRLFMTVELVVALGIITYILEIDMYKGGRIWTKKNLP